MVVVNVSLALDLVRSFFCLETSPHWEMVPGENETGQLCPGAEGDRQLKTEKRGVGQKGKTRKSKGGAGGGKSEVVANELTIGDALNGQSFIAVGLLQAVEDVNV